MGNEATCRVEIGEKSAEAKALLETGEILILRRSLVAAERFVIPVDNTRVDRG